MPATRQLAAILFADIEGYTALMQDDETQAIIVREKFQKVLEHEVKNHNGRIVQFSGDGALCIFQSAIEAVRAAESIQLQMIAEPNVPLRIGIHTGDVITEGENVYGNGVNVASRIESFAVPGAVFVSGKVYDEIKNQKEIGTVSLGRFELKNVSERMEIYAISNSGLVVPSKEKLQGKGSPLAKKKVPANKIFITAVVGIVLIALAIFLYPKFSSRAKDSSTSKTIAVLPFANLSARKDDEYFADGICDEILTQLSKISALNVISRTSTLQFKDTKKTMKQIGEQIGADMLLEGSVQKSNDKVRIHAELIDAKSDKQLWAETYDREMKDVFAIQTDIAKQIAVAMNATLANDEKSLFEEKPTENLEAYDFYLRGKKYAETFWDYDKMDDVPQAVLMFERAIKLDPKFLQAYNALIALQIEISWRKPVINSNEYRVKAKAWLDKMVALNLDKPIVHATLALYKYEGERDYAGALAEYDIVDHMLGNDKSTLSNKAFVLRRMGRLNASLALFKKKADLFPKNASARLDVAETYALMKDFQSAMQSINETIELSPDIAVFYWDKASFYSDFRGDLKNAFATLHDAQSFVDSDNLTGAYIYLEMQSGNYSSAIHRLLTRTDSFYHFSQSNVIPNALLIAVMYSNEGDNENAKIYFQKSFNIMSRLVKLYPDDFRMHSTLGIAYAGLGEKENALFEGSKAKEMMPVSKDAIMGIAPLEGLALIHTLLGEQDAAIDILEQILKMPYGWDVTNTIPLYKNHPYWKLLQNNPRFNKMIQQSK